MLDSFWVCVLVGTALGGLSGLGVGGGSLLILWLTLVLETEQSVARGINLLFFLPAALVACCFRWRQGAIRFQMLMPALIAGPLAAGIFSWLGRNLDTSLMKKGFGILLLVTGFRELLYRPASKN